MFLTLPNRRGIVLLPHRDPISILVMNLVSAPWKTLRLRYKDQLINAVDIITVYSENYEKAINAYCRQDAEFMYFEAHDKA
jgi:hypothetical protein